MPPRIDIYPPEVRQGGPVYPPEVRQGGLSSDNGHGVGVADRPQKSIRNHPKPIQNHLRLSYVHLTFIGMYQSIQKISPPAMPQWSRAHDLKPTARRGTGVETSRQHFSEDPQGGVTSGTGSKIGFLRPKSTPTHPKSIETQIIMSYKPINFIRGTRTTKTYYFH